MLSWRHYFKKVTNWQYWPAWFFYIPPVFYYLFMALKSRDLFFYQAVNPTWYNSGMKGDSKWVIQQYFCSSVMPRSILLKDQLKEGDIAPLRFPMVIKPDVGQRGKGVKVVYTTVEVNAYLKQGKDYSLLQEYSDLPQEWGVFYVRYPGQQIGKITSLMQRQFWSVIGDGKQSVWQLAQLTADWILQYKHVRQHQSEWQRIIPAKGEQYILEPIGNHNRGTAFLDKRAKISTLLVHRIEQLIQPFPDFYYGRLDLKIRSMDHFLQGGDAHIIEINGFGAEPAHIYQTGFSLLKAWCDVFYHIKLAFLIARENKSEGIKSLSFKKSLKMFFEQEKIAQKPKFEEPPTIKKMNLFINSH